MFDVCYYIDGGSCGIEASADTFDDANEIAENLRRSHPTWAVWVVDRNIHS